MTHSYMSSMESLAESRFESDTDENDRATSRMFSDTVNTAAPDGDPTVVLVGEHLRQDAELISMITDRFRLEIVFSDHGTEYITADEKGGASASQNLVFVLSDFEGGDFNYLNGYTRIVSPVAIRYCARNGKKFPIVRARRPLYCYAMRGMSFALDGYSRTECRRAVNLIHFMGGSARKEYRNPLILVAKNAGSIIAKNALTASTAETPVLTLEWIEACWKLRDDTDFVATDQAMMETYKFKCFQGLRIFFLAFPEGPDLAEMTKKTTELNGSLAKTYKEATHVVCDVDFRSKQVAWNDMAPDFPHPKIAHVTTQWFWQSVHKNECLREDLYPAIKNHEYRPLQPKENLRKRNAVSPVANEILKGRRNNSSKASLDNSVDNSANSSLPEHMFSSDALDEIALPKKNDKRFQVCMEMLETEENYLRMLKLIKSIYRDPLEECLKGDKPDPILSRGEINRIFDKVAPLIPVHENILEQLRCIIKNWNSQQLVGSVWAYGANDMVKVYSQYVNSYDEALKTLEECDERRPKFHSFLKAGEANPSCQKNSLKDMLIRPVQRIPSVLLLLRELKKRTEKHHPDFHAITEGIQKIEKVLEKTNESRRQTETFERFMGVCNDIENFPLELISSSREFICQADFTLLEVDAAGPLSRNKSRPVTLLLFNDIVVIAKIKHTANANTSMSFQGGTLTRQMSLLPTPRLGLFRFGSGKQKKQYKHIETLRFNSIREAFFVRDQGVFFIKVRDASADFLCSFQISQDTTVDSAVDFFHAVLQKVASSSFRREVVLEEMTTQTMTKAKILTEEDQIIMERHLKSAEQLSHSGTIRRPSLRRALSSASFSNFTHSLTRFTSKATLPNINESLK